MIRKIVFFVHNTCEKREKESYVTVKDGNSRNTNYRRIFVFFSIKREQNCDCMLLLLQILVVGKESSFSSLNFFKAYHGKKDYKEVKVW